MKDDKACGIFLFLFDSLALSIAYILSSNFSGIVHDYLKTSRSSNGEEIFIFLLVFVLFLFFAVRFKVRDQGSFNPRDRSTKAIIKAQALSFFMVGFLIFIIRFDSTSLIFFTLFFLTSLVLIPIFHLLSKKIYNGRKLQKKYILIVGTDLLVRKFVRSIRNDTTEKMEIIGFLTYNPCSKKKFLGYDILGQAGDLERIITENVIDMIVLFPAFDKLETMRDMVKTCEIEGIEVLVYSDVFELSTASMRVLDYDGMHILKFSTSEKEPYMLIIKRMIDVLGAVFLLLLTSPVILLTSIAIKIESGINAPVFFTQYRSGLNSRKFKLYKFTSMIENAERLKEGLSNRNEAEGPIFKMKKDPRITRVGEIIRKLSIDELPQLYNVLVGDMSLVGPRPPLPKEVKLYDRWQRRRLSMKPGLTCIWQVSGRSNISFEKWMKMDLEYIDQWSLMLDFEILFKTIPAVLSGKGAY